MSGQMFKIMDNSDPTDISVFPATLNDLSYIDSLQRKNAEELAFYPKQVFEREVQNFRILLAQVNGEPAGYIYHGALGHHVRIHQACIQYDLRGQLYGAALVKFLLRLVGSANGQCVTLRCGSDIAANGFWRTMGFYCQGVTKGGVRRMRDINNWRFDLQPQLLVTSCEPSSRKKDASLWRRNKGEKQTQFMRGKQMLSYREILEKKDNEQ
jgi:hypothetical protein